MSVTFGLDHNVDVDRPSASTFGLDHNNESPRSRAVTFGLDHDAQIRSVQLMKPKEIAKNNRTGEGIQAGHFDPGALSADPTGRAAMASGYFDAATAADKIAAGAIPVSKLAQAPLTSPLSADLDAGAKKITNLANGVFAQDAAAFGQIPTTLPPSGSASGDLAGSYPSPTVAKASGPLALPGAISPTALAADANDYAPTGLAGASSVRLSSSLAVNITGLSAGSAGSLLVLHNVGTFAITLKNENAGSLAANRFLFDADIVLAANQSATLRYDATSSRWRTVSSVGSGGGGGGGDASTVTYTPTTPANWNPVPTHVQDALDDLAAGRSASNPGGRFYVSAAQSIPTSTEQPIALDGEEFNTIGSAFHSTSSNPSRINCLVAGRYLFIGTVRLAAAACDRYVAFRKNGVRIANGNVTATTTSVSVEYASPIVLNLVPGDYVEIVAWHDNAAPLAVTTGADQSWVNAIYLGGSTSPILGCKVNYGGAVTASGDNHVSVPNNSFYEVPFDGSSTTMWDFGPMHSLVNPSRLTVPTGGDGVWRVSGASSFANTLTTGIRQLLLYHYSSGGVLKDKAETDLLGATGNAPQNIALSAEFNAVAGDYFVMVAYQNTGSPMTLRAFGNTFLSATLISAFNGGAAFDILGAAKLLWLRADADTYTDNTFGTPATADGAAVGGWKDQSGMGLDASTAGTKPTLKTNIVNGKPVLRFSSAELDTANVRIPYENACIFFVASRPWQTNGVFRALLGQSAGAEFAVYLATTNSGDWLTKWIAYGSASSAGQPPRVVAYKSLTDNTFHVFGIRLGVLCDWRVDGVSVATSRALGLNASAPVLPLRIGQEGSSSFFDGDLAELLIVPGALDPRTFANIERYLGAKYGIAVA